MTVISVSYLDESCQNAVEVQSNGKICCLAMVNGVKLIKAERYDEQSAEDRIDE
jgi:hypothetical protein